MQDLEQAIRERAYHLWIANGEDGDAEAHWLTAQREILASSLGVSTTHSAPRKAAKKTPSKRSRAA